MGEVGAGGNPSTVHALSRWACNANGKEVVIVNKKGLTSRGPCHGYRSGRGIRKFLLFRGRTSKMGQGHCFRLFNCNLVCGFRSATG